MLRYVKGDVTDPRKYVSEGPVVIPHVLSETGAYHAGVAAAIKAKWPRAYELWSAFLKESRRTRRSMFGHTQLVFVEDNIAIGNLCAQRGLSSITNPQPLDYELLRHCLKALAALLLEEEYFAQATIHMPKLGCGLAGGSWDQVEPIVEETLKDFICYVYEYTPGA